MDKAKVMYLLATLAVFALRADAYNYIGQFCKEGQDHCVCSDFSCWCEAGYESAGDRKTCRDHNECACGHHTCSNVEVCLNTEGSFVCIAPEHLVVLLEAHEPVYEAITAECKRGEAHCFCKNLSCACEDGYIPAGDELSCIDLDECSCEPFPCGMYELCLNTHGSYDCLEGQDVIDLITESGGCAGATPDSETPPTEPDVDETVTEEESPDTQVRIDFHFVEKQYTCDEHSVEIFTCKVCIATYNQIDKDVDVNVKTVTVSAKAGDDYGSISTQLQFTDGGLVKQCIDIEIFPDNIKEQSELLVVEMMFVDECEEERTAVTTVLIADSCHENMTIGFTQPVYTVNEGNGSVHVCVDVQGDKLNKQVLFSTHSLSEIGSSYAHDTSDFYPISFIIDCGDVNSQYCLDIKIEDDSFPEETETFVVYLSSLSACIDTELPLAKVNIIDNDEPEQEDTAQLEKQLEFRFLERQFTCKEKSDEISLCRVYIGAYGILNSARHVNLSTVESPDYSEDYHSTVEFIYGGDNIERVDLQILPNSDSEKDRIIVVKLGYVNDCDEYCTDYASVIVERSCTEISQIDFVQPVYTVGEGMGSVSICVNIVGGSSRKRFTIATVSLPESSSSRAEVNVDFKHEWKDVSCADVPENNIYCIEIMIKEDSIVEGSEEFMVFITDLSACIESSQQLATIVITDND